MSVATGYQTNLTSQEMANQLTPNFANPPGFPLPNYNYQMQNTTSLNKVDELNFEEEDDEEGENEKGINV